MIRRNSIGRQAALRLFVSLGLLVALIATGTVGIYQAALQKAAHKRADELVSFYAARIDQIEREWEIRSRDFKVRIEITRALEDTARAVTNLQAFMTVQGADRPFRYLLIQDADGRKLFEFGRDMGLASIPASAAEGVGHYLDRESGDTYRVFAHPIWLGEGRAMGRFAVFFPIDNALLRQMSTPGLTLSLLHTGEPVASSGGQIAIEELRRGTSGTGGENRDLSWGGKADAPLRLHIAAPLTTLFSTAELVVGVSVIPLVDGLVLWFTIGLWLMRQTRRITVLGAAVAEYGTAHRVTDALTAKLAGARTGKADEIAEVADAVETLTGMIDRRAQEREEAAERLRQSEARLREITAVLGTGVFVIDAQGLITFVNPAAEKMLGWSAAELLGKGSHRTFHHSKADGSPHAEADCPVHQTLCHGLSHDSVPDEFIRQDGSRIPVSLSSAPILRDGKAVGAVVGFDDVSERLAAEEALLRLNEELETRVAERTRELKLANVKLHAEQEELRALIDQLEQAHHQLLQAEKLASIGQLAAGVAHEINNPIGFVNSNLGTLRGYIDGLLEVLDQYEHCEQRVAAGGVADLALLRDAKERIGLDFLREDTRVLLAESLDGIRRVREIVQSLKDFAHIDEGQWQYVDLHQGLESTLKLVSNEIKYKADVVKEYGNLPPVECNASQINQVFMNLLINAAQSIDSRGTIRLSSGVANGGVWIEIADSGCGIPPEHMTRVFDPFFTTKPIGKGTGLGLSVSYGIIQQHRGRLDVDSTVGRGTRFRIWLPLRQTAGNEAAARVNT